VQVLSANREAVVTVDDLLPGLDFRHSLRRQDLEAEWEPLFARAEQVVLDAVTAAGMTLDQVKGVEVTGGAWRVPGVQARLAELFFPVVIGKSLNADEAAAEGAAMMALALDSTPRGRVRQPDVKDVLGRELKLTAAGALGAVVAPAVLFVPAGTTLHVLDATKWTTINFTLSAGGDFLASLWCSGVEHGTTVKEIGWWAWPMLGWWSWPVLGWNPVGHGQSRSSRTSPEQLLGRYAIIGVARSLGKESRMGAEDKRLKLGPRAGANAEVVVWVQIDRSGVADIIRAERIVRRTVPPFKTSTCSSGRKEEQFLGEVMERQNLTVVRVGNGGGWSGLSLEEEADAAAVLQTLEKNEDQMWNEAESRNRLESLTYRMQETLDGAAVLGVIDPSERARADAHLVSTRDWLETAGLDASHQCILQLELQLEKSLKLCQLLYSAIQLSEHPDAMGATLQLEANSTPATPGQALGASASDTTSLPSKEWINVVEAKHVTLPPHEHKAGTVVYGLWAMGYGLLAMVYGLWAFLDGLWSFVYGLFSASFLALAVLI